MAEFTHRRNELTVEYPDYASELARRLADKVEGEVRFDPGSRGAYSTDASNYRQIPIGVVVPRGKEDVVETVRLCREFGAPITSRGGGTSLAGQCCNVAVVIDWSKYMHHVLEVDTKRKLARVQPGCVLDHLRQEAGQHGLTFGPDPATHNHCTLGGMIGNNSCGVRSVMAQFYGPGPTTRHNVESLEVLTYRGDRFTVGETRPEELEQIIRGGGARGEIYRRLRDLRDEHLEEIRTRYTNIPRRVSGYNLEALLEEKGFNVAQALVGTEGTCVVILEATVRLIDARPERTLVVLGYPDVYRAGDHVPTVMEHKPVGLEGMDDMLVDFMKKKGLHPEDVDILPEGNGWLLVEFGADEKADADRQAERFADDIQKVDDPPSVKVMKDAWEEEKIWQVRESGLAATAHVPDMPEAWPGWEDAAVAPDNVGKYLRDFRRLLDEFDYQASLYGHFGQGCIHCRITFDLETAAGIEKYLAFIDRAADLVVKYKGSISGEHGDGQSRAALLNKMFGDDMVRAFGEFKGIWDPDGRMNPGKVVDPYTPDQNLKLSPTTYRPREQQTYFQFPADGYSFVGATNRCVGVGKCRRTEGGTMCPSYMVTREEEHSTRGRARLLFEMLQGDVIHGWRDKHVHEALDLCLACKGCKNECPVNVDMATYKAEFLAHYYKGRLRPRQAYSMGLIYWWARLAAWAPQVANFFSQNKYTAPVLKFLGGIAPQRRMPQFAGQTFVAWFRDHRSKRERPHFPQSSGHGPGPMTAGRNGNGKLQHREVPRHQTDSYSENKASYRLNPQSLEQPYTSGRVLLWPDTFTNHLTPEVARAATLVLEEAGYKVEIPPRPLCCGRPLYDYGMLTTAKKLWRQTLDTLQEVIREGIPVVGLEPSCVAAFRDELGNLFPHDEDAVRLQKQTLIFSEFLEHQQYQPPRLRRKALVHGHCHHKAIMHMDAEIAVLKKLGLDFEVLNSGCCGMAGSFGFERGKYDVSVACGERVLLPAVRAADEDTLIIADGFSCREQVLQCTGRRALHVAEVILLALQEGEPPEHHQGERRGQRSAAGAGKPQ